MRHVVYRLFVESPNCYRTAFYLYFYIITMQSSISFYHDFLQIISPDNEVSWEDYILHYLKYRFTSYALRLTMLLNIAFTL